MFTSTPSLPALPLTVQAVDLLVTRSLLDGPVSSASRKASVGRVTAPGRVAGFITRSQGRVALVRVLALPAVSVVRAYSV